MNINIQILMDYNKEKKSLYGSKQVFIEESNLFASEVENYAKKQALKNKTVDHECLEKLTKKFHNHLLEAILLKYKERKLDKLEELIYEKTPKYLEEHYD